MISQIMSPIISFDSIHNFTNRVVYFNLKKIDLAFTIWIKYSEVIKLR